MQGVSGSSPLVSTKTKRHLKWCLFVLTGTVSNHLALSGLFAFGFANALCSHPVRARIVVRIPLAEYCVIRRARPTNSKVHLSPPKQRGCLIKIAQKKKKADVLYQKVLSIRLLFGIIKSPNPIIQKARLIIHQ